MLTNMNWGIGDDENSDNGGQGQGKKWINLANVILSLPTQEFI